MYKCDRCGAAFEEPKQWLEIHGDNYTFNEKMTGCPACGESGYSEAETCICCEEYTATDDLTLGFCRSCGRRIQMKLNKLIDDKFTFREKEYLQEIGVIA